MQILDKSKQEHLAGGIPGELLERLSEDESSRAALNTPAVRVLTDLRNALAHGGIAYLDERGCQTDGQAAMLAFVGAVMKGGRLPPLTDV